MTIVMKEMMDCIENPVKTKLLLALQTKGTATPKELHQVNSEIPKATLYRALKSMESAGIIEVVSEIKVRAVVEKTYAISTEFAHMGEQVVNNNDGEAYYKMFSAFMITLLQKFERYGKQENLNIEEDGSSFNALSIYATAEELTEYSEKIMQILTPAMTKTSDEQKQYTFATIVSPPTENE
ncbi:helix-turn-helix domain-containing protein [Enterococcus sp. AZ109]|uniref:helix-turn-helix domain-containing protein n=1 Tax=Enterococcus sp. AZ109 TaxID=2774634 RepID=UPI003F2160A0